MKEKSIIDYNKYFNGNGKLENDIISNQSQKKNLFPKKPKAIPFVIFKENKFQIPDEASKLLIQKEYANIGIIILVGKYRADKSFLLNKLILNIHQT